MIFRQQFLAGMGRAANIPLYLFVFVILGPDAILARKQQTIHWAKEDKMAYNLWSWSCANKCLLDYNPPSLRDRNSQAENVCEIFGWMVHGEGGLYLLLFLFRLISSFCLSGRGGGWGVCVQFSDVIRTTYQQKFLGSRSILFSAKEFHRFGIRDRRLFRA